MKLLKSCDDMLGHAKLFTSDPPVTEVGGAYYIPHDFGNVWGIFDGHGVAVQEALDLHGLDCHLLDQSIDFDPLGVEVRDAPETAYIYGGNIHFHFGHFIVNTLSRFWPLTQNRKSPFKILMHGPGNPKGWFEQDFVREAFGALGLTAADFVKFDVPTRIPQLIVPGPGFQEQHFIHSAFADLCRQIGWELLRGYDLRPNPRPVYLTKREMTSGYWKFVDESDIANYLADAGVEIVVPERISLTEKIKIFAEREFITGVVSSGLHTSLFWPPTTRGVGLSIAPAVNSNMPLFDLANKSDFRYVFSPERVIVQSSRPGFHLDAFFGRPALIAKDILELLSPR